MAWMHVGHNLTLQATQVHAHARSVARHPNDRLPMITTIGLVVHAGIKAIAAGDRHSMVLKTDGSVWADSVWAAGDKWPGNYGNGKSYLSKKWGYSSVYFMKVVSSGQCVSV